MNITKTLFLLIYTLELLSLTECKFNCSHSKNNQKQDRSDEAQPSIENNLDVDNVENG